jgi:coenzyme F420-0:L-glutamate ligase
MSALRIEAVAGLPEFREGMAVGAEIAARASLRGDDVLVVSQKIVSKAEGRLRRLADVSPGPEAQKLARQLDKDPALVELILAESAEVLRAERGVLIVETHHGFVCANAGIDTSNVPDEDVVCLLPADPDASARRIREEIHRAAGESGVGVAGHSTASHRRAVSADPSPDSSRLTRWPASTQSPTCRWRSMSVLSKGWRFHSVPSNG